MVIKNKFYVKENIIDVRTLVARELRSCAAFG